MPYRERVLEGDLAAVASLLAPIAAKVPQDFLVAVELVAEFVKSGLHRSDRLEVRSARRHLARGQAQVEGDDDPLDPGPVVDDALEVDQVRPKHLHAALQFF